MHLIDLSDSCCDADEFCFYVPISIPEFPIHRLSIFLKNFLKNQLWRQNESSDRKSSEAGAYSLNILDLVTPEETEETVGDQPPSEQEQQQQQPQHQQTLNLVMERNVLKPLQQQIDAIDASIKSYLPGCRFGTAERCLLVAQLFGDESASIFWLVALHYLERGAQRKTPVHSEWND